MKQTNSAVSVAVAVDEAKERTRPMLPGLVPIAAALVLAIFVLRRRARKSRNMSPPTA